jgi:hypothetical protein
MINNPYLFDFIGRGGAITSINIGFAKYPSIRTQNFLGALKSGHSNICSMKIYCHLNELHSIGISHH